MINSIKVKGLAISLIAASMLPIVVYAAGSTFQTADMQDFAYPHDYATGAATLTRHAGGIQLRGSGNGFTPNAVYTAWFVIFNKPGNCAGGPGACNGGDLGNPAVHGAVLNASGFVATGDGNGYFSGSLESGPAPDGLTIFGQLNNGNKAEVHIVLLDHGVRNAGEIAAHMSTTPGGVDQFFFLFPAAN